ncbi:NADP-dependent malic enzyme [Fasciola hepatica]|uniref:Malic enzyme n=1 Tax=Fasciola hepatica TaxID=6192 RepID=A0A4E0RCT2_FASHE|nr:NADP-dependent malic enzyme [Fasciola hepatica]
MFSVHLQLLRVALRGMCNEGARGLHILRDPLMNKGIAFGAAERSSLKLTGLIPPLGGKGADLKENAAEEYIENVSMTRLRRFESDFDRYDWLMNLADHNKDLFFRLLNKHPDYIMPLVYTPTVGLACQNLSLVYNSGRGLFITIHDKGNIKSVLQNWPEKDIRAIVVTDGERILGLGDQGAFGMGIPVGKLSLYTGLAGIPPQYCLPITLDVGTNSETLLNSPLYFGLKRKRSTGKEYDDLIDEFMEACTSTYGKSVLVQFEDFANHNAFRLLHKYQNSYSTFNDDIQGTASVVLAGLLASGKLTGRKLSEERILCYGSGEAAIGFSHLVSRALTRRYGMSAEQAKEHLFLVDSKGLVVKDRKTGGLTDHKLEFARPAGTPELTSLEEIIKFTKCTALIGAAAVPRVFTPKILGLMAELNEKPLIMALSNPTAKAECTAEEAYKHTKGRCVFASGSPFAPVHLAAGSTPGIERPIDRHPGQANNAYIFPGVALGIVTGKISPVTNDDFLVASETLSALVADSDYKLGRLFPPLTDIRRVSKAIAREVILAAIPEGRCRAADGKKLSSSDVDNLVANFSNYPPEK